MRRRLRILIVLASTFAMVLVLNVGTAFAHDNGNENNTFPGGANNNAAVLQPVDPLAWNGAFDTLNANALPGVLQGFEANSPMCTTHYFTVDHIPPPE